MCATLAALLASVVLAATPTPTPATDPEPPAPATPGEGEAPVQAPPGSAEDQALWRAGQAVAPDIARARVKANKLQWEARQARTLERLTAMAKAEEDPSAKKAAELLPRYQAALAFNHHTLTRQWPVDPTRGCGYSVMAFESALYSGDHRRRTSQLSLTREDLQDCVSRAEPALKVMVESNRELERLTAEAQSLLPPAAAARPRPATPAKN